MAVLLIVGVMGPPVAARPVDFSGGSAVQSEPVAATPGSPRTDCERLRTIVEQLAGAPTGSELPPDLASQLAICDGLARAEPPGEGGPASRALAPSVAGSGSIGGTVTGPEGQGLPGITVYACPQGPGSCGSGNTAGDGTYSIGGLTAASYRVEFHDYSAMYASGFYSSAGLVIDYASATPVTPDATGVDVELPLGLHIGGTVTGPDGKAITGFYAYACPVSGGICGYGSTPGDGTYSIGGLLAATYRVGFYEYTGSYASGLYSSAGLVVDYASATPVIPDATGIDVELPLGLHIGGTVTGPDGLGLAAVSAWACPVTGGVCSSATTAEDGSYSIGRLLAGSYRVWFFDPNGTRVSGYYSSSGLTWDYSQATPVTVPPDAIGIDVELFVASHISGTVTGPGGVGLEWISVDACPATGGGACGSTTTAAAGMYSIGGLAPGSYRVHFSDYNGFYATGYYSSSGLTPDYSKATLVTVPPDATGIDVALPLANHISGTVTGPSGSGLAGISVSAYPQGTASSRSATTRSDGTYSIGGLWPGSYRLWLNDPSGTYVSGYYSSSGLTPDYSKATLVTVPPDATGIDVALPLANHISGTVTGPSATGLAGINVDACVDDPPLYSCFSTTTLAGGTYSVGGLRAASYTIRFTDLSRTYASGYYSSSGLTPVRSEATLVVVPPDAVGIDVTLPIASRINGTVSRPEGDGLAGISVSACPLEYGECGWATTAADGTYSVGGLAAGSYRVWFHDSTNTYLGGYYSASGLTSDPADATFVTVPPAASGIDVVLPLGHRISGTVTEPSGASLAGILVTACSPESGCGQAESAADGTYLVKGLEAASYTVEFRDPTDDHATGYYSTSGFTPYGSAATLVAVPPDATGIDVTLPLGLRISGTVVDTSGLALVGIKVQACAIDRYDCHVATSNASGAYAVRGLSPGDHRVGFTDPTGSYLNGYYGPAGFVIRAKDAAPVRPDATGIDVRMPAAAHIGGTVTGPTGSGIAWVGVTACLAADGSCRYGRADATGAYSVGGLAPGSYRVLFRDQYLTYASGYYSAAGFTSDPSLATLVVVPPDAAAIDITLPLGSTIRGVVTEASGARLGNISVTACPSVAPGLCASALTSSTGRYAIKGLAAGSYRVEFLDWNGIHATGYYGASGFTPDPAAAAAVVVPPDASGVDVVLPVGYRIGGTVTGPRGDPASRIVVDACSPVGGWCRTATTGSDGRYTVMGLAAGDYRVSFHDSLDRYASGYYGDGGFTADPAAAAIIPTPPDAAGIDVALPGARHISGTVTGPGGISLSGIHVTACPTSGAEFCGTDATGADGTYAVGGLVRGSYEVKFEDPTHTYADGFYHSSGFSTDQSTRIRVYLEEVTGIDVQTWLATDPPTRYIVTASDYRPKAGAAVTISAQLADAAGRPIAVAGMVVTWSLTGGSGSLAATTSTTNRDGVATVVFGMGSVPGRIRYVTATDAAGRTGTSPGISRRAIR